MLSHEDQMYLLPGRVHTAAQTLEALAPPHEGRPMRWANSDFYSFDATMELEAHIVEHGLGAVQYAARLAVGQHVADWRKALPYTDAERQRLYEVEQEHGYVRLAGPVRQTIKHELIVDAGLERIIDGNDLMRRWWKWRRGIDQFADQNGPNQAATALRLAHEELCSI